MYHRKQTLQDAQTESIFLFGARQTGKSMLLRTLFPDCIYIDLLETNLQNRLREHPDLLRELLEPAQDEALVIIDEIQLVPQLLEEIHLLISRRQMRFVLCGSSARKLKRQGVNTLGGRALPENLYPLVSAEIPDFDLQRALNEVESQIAAARRAYNAAVTDYNNAIEMFPGNLMAGMMLLKSKQVFTATETERGNVNVKNLFNS